MTHGGLSCGLTRRRSMVAGMLPLLLALVLVAACAQSGLAGRTSSSATTRPSHAPLPTYTPAPSPVAITDLNQFRRRLTSAMTSGKWAQVAVLLSPAFSFQGLNSGGGRLEMPGAAQDFQQQYNAAGGWTQTSRPVDILFCDAGATPKIQQMGFAGGDGSYLLMGIARWQGYWVVAWVFQDPIGESGGCA